MRYFLYALFSICLLFPSFSAHAETKIAVIDVQRVMTQSKAALSLKKQGEELRAQYLAEISKKEKALRKLEKELVQNAKSLAEEERLSKKQDFEKQLLETRSFAQDRKRGLDTATQDVNRMLQKTLYEISQKIADEEGYDLIISNQSIITGKSELDITDKVIDQFNEVMPEISLKVSK